MIFNTYDWDDPRSAPPPRPNKRDGKADGQLTEHPVRCPKCERVNTSRHAKCLYCGQEFEGDLFATLGK